MIFPEPAQVDFPPQSLLGFVAFGLVILFIRWLERAEIMPSVSKRPRMRMFAELAAYPFIFITLVSSMIVLAQVTYRFNPDTVEAVHILTLPDERSIPGKPKIVVTDTKEISAAFSYLKKAPLAFRNRRGFTDGYMLQLEFRSSRLSPPKCLLAFSRTNSGEPVSLIFVTFCPTEHICWGPISTLNSPDFLGWIEEQLS
jgi:hypothetical protein